MQRFFDHRAKTTMFRAGGRRLGCIFCWCCLIMWQPLHDDRIAAPVREPMKKTVQTTASSASDRGSCEVLLPSYGERGQGQDQLLSSLQREPNNAST